MHGEHARLDRVLAACGGFLLGILWMDLMFDVQVLHYAASVELPEPIVVSIATYYRRVTTDARPMSALIGTVMAVAVGGTLWQLIRSPGLRSLLGFLLIAAPVALAFGRVLPDAVRLGQRSDSLAVQGELARSICRGHLLCLASVVGFLIVQLRGVHRVDGSRTSLQKRC
jgi:hypothetical protein